jgi:hypothetical protein
VSKIVPFQPRTEAFLAALEFEVTAYKINRDDPVELEAFKVAFAAGWVASKQNTLSVLNSISKDDENE